MVSLQKILPAAFIFLLLLIPIKSAAQEKEKTDAPNTLAELQTAIEKVLDDSGTPGVGVALVHKDSTLWAAGLGRANIENEVAATENTMFRIGSTSKMFVSLAILKLQEGGRLNLKDKVRDLVPEIEFENPWRDTNPILVEHLLEHTTGWDDIHLTEYAFDAKDLSLKEGLDFHPHSRKSRWVPGTRMSYCNSGPPVAAFIVEKVSGQTFEDYVQEHFFGPMGMENATYFESDRYKKLGATLYLQGEPQKYWNIIMRPSGSINASPKDMAQMLKFFVNRGRADSLQLITEASLKRMETPSSTPAAEAGLELGYGLSNYTSPHESFVYHGHNGGVNGGLTDFAYLPSHQVGYVVMINSGNGGALSRITKLIRNFQTSHFDSDKVDYDKNKTIPDEDISGYYVAINPRMQMSYYMERIVGIKRIKAKTNFVRFSNLFGGGAKTYTPLKNGTYVSPETGKTNMVKVNDPIAGEVVHRGSQVLRPISPVIVFGQIGLLVIWVLYLLSVICVGSIWFFFYWIGKVSKRDHIGALLWPYLTCLFFVAAQIMAIVGGMNPFEFLGKPSFVSVSIMILSICFALASIWSVVKLAKARKAKINKHLYWHLAIFTGLNVVVTLYLLWHGMIGIQFWG